MPPASVEISVPRTSATPVALTALAASSQPAVVSWSVSAITSTAARWAARISSPGVSVPSEHVECVCRSMSIGLDPSDPGAWQAP
jgi:hypothetical protein